MGTEVVVTEILKRSIDRIATEWTAAFGKVETGSYEVDRASLSSALDALGESYSLGTQDTSSEVPPAESQNAK